MNINKALKALKAEDCELRKAMKYNYSLVKYVLAEPPQTQDELEALLTFFAAVHLKYEQYEFQPGFGVVICLGAEAMLKRYRTTRSEEAALCFALQTENWRQCCTKWAPAAKKYFRQEQRQVPHPLWELKDIPLNAFATLMLPKAAAGGHINASLSSA